MKKQHFITLAVLLILGSFLLIFDLTKNQYVGGGYKSSPVSEVYDYSPATTTDALIKSGPGKINNIVISQDDAAPTAGSIVVYDGTASSGPEIFNWTLTTAVFNPITVQLNHYFDNGIFVDFVTTADVNVSASYK